MKHLSFDTREREYRDVNGRDDADAEQRGADDLTRRIKHHG